MNMKKIIFFIFVLAMSVSCMGLMDKGHTYQSSYTLNANFEYTTVDYIKDFGEDSLYFDSARCVGIGFKDFAFYHKTNADTTDVLGGFMLSYLQTPADLSQLDTLNKRWRAYASPITKINTYLVHRTADVKTDMPAHVVEFLNTQYGTCVMESCLVTNTVEVADSIMSNFSIGDKLMLKAIGYAGGQKTGSAEFMLAERASTKDSIVTNWSLFDLSPLGAVEQVDFELEVLSNQELAIPKFFCLDEFTASISIAY